MRAYDPDGRMYFETALPSFPADLPQTYQEGLAHVGSADFEDEAINGQDRDFRIIVVGGPASTVGVLPRSSGARPLLLECAFELVDPGAQSSDLALRQDGYHSPPPRTDAGEDFVRTAEGLAGLLAEAGFDVVADDITFGNFGLVTSIIDLWDQMLISVIVVLLAVPRTVLVASWAGFAIVTGPKKTGAVLVVVSVVALMVPATALWVPRFVMFKWLGLIDTLWALMVPALMATSPFYVLVFALAYSRIPTQLYEAARVEGLSPLRTWATVAWPASCAQARACSVSATPRPRPRASGSVAVPNGRSGVVVYNTPDVRIGGARLLGSVGSRHAGRGNWHQLVIAGNGKIFKSR